MRLLKQSTAYDLMVFMVDSSDHVTGKASLTLTITASKQGAAFASISPTVTDRSNGWYEVQLTSANTDTLGDLAIHITATGADPTDLVCQVGPVHSDVISWLGTAADTPDSPGVPNVNVLEWRGQTVAGINGSGEFTAASFATGFITAAKIASNAITNTKFEVGAIDDLVLVADGITASKIAANSIGASELAADAVAEIADAVWDEATSGHTTAGTFGKLVADIFSGLPSATAVRDAILNYEFRTGRTVRAVLRRLSAAIGGRVQNLDGSTVIFYQPDGVTEEYRVTQDPTNGNRTAEDVTNSETP